jgi:ABC-type glycerol-3-phosphate transport system substrate-binding protein
MRRAGLVWGAVATLIGAVFSTSACATTDIEVWHAMTGASADTFGELVERFNAQQSAVHVTLTYKGNGAATLAAALAALKTRTEPDLVEVDDEESESLFQSTGIVKPMYEVLALDHSADFNFFLPASVAFMRDAHGRLLGFPYQASVPVFVWNRDAYIKAGLDPDAPPKTWRDLQKQLIALQDNGRGVACPYTTSEQSWIHIENLSTLHGETFATKNNGLLGGGAELTYNDLLHVRHTALLESWVVSQLFHYYGPEREGDAKFASGDCATLTTGSDALGDFIKTAKFSMGVAPMPFYEEGARSPLNTLVNGSALVALEGKKPEAYKAMAIFLAYLSTPVAAAEWTQKTGSLPLTSAALDASVKSNGYAKVQGFADVMREVTTVGGPSVRGERLPEFAKVRAIGDHELEQVWNGSKAPKQALDDAVREGNLAMRLASPPPVAPPAKHVAPKAKPKTTS